MRQDGTVFGEVVGEELEEVEKLLANESKQYALVRLMLIFIFPSLLNPIYPSKKSVAKNSTT